MYWILVTAFVTIPAEPAEQATFAVTPRSQIPELFCGLFGKMLSVQGFAKSERLRDPGVLLYVLIVSVRHGRHFIHC